MGTYSYFLTSSISPRATSQSQLTIPLRSSSATVPSQIPSTTTLAISSVLSALLAPRVPLMASQSEREGYDFEQIYLTSRVVLATLLEVAGFAFV